MQMMIGIRSPKKTGNGFEFENSGLKGYRDDCTQANIKWVINFYIEAEVAFKNFELGIFYLDWLEIFILPWLIGDLYFTLNDWRFLFYLDWLEMLLENLSGLAAAPCVNPPGMEELLLGGYKWVFFDPPQNWKCSPVVDKRFVKLPYFKGKFS